MSELMNDLLLPFKEYIRSYAYVGSRVTCDPPPIDTDIDILVLTNNHIIFLQTAEKIGYELDGSGVGDRFGLEEIRFFSIKYNDVNLIVTPHEDFFKRFIAASTVAKRLNLKHKSDRVALFQAVLYHNDCGGIGVEIS